MDTSDSVVVESGADGQGSSSFSAGGSSCRPRSLDLSQVGSQIPSGCDCSQFHRTCQRTVEALPTRFPRRLRVVSSA
eukprot:scaffold150889_cov39-Tisochrysis_lutea.AAC.2